MDCRGLRAQPLFVRIMRGYIRLHTQHNLTRSIFFLFRQMVLQFTLKKIRIAESQTYIYSNKQTYIYFNKRTNKYNMTTISFKLILLSLFSFLSSSVLAICTDKNETLLLQSPSELQAAIDALPGTGGTICMTGGWDRASSMFPCSNNASDTVRIPAGKDVLLYNTEAAFGDGQFVFGCNGTALVSTLLRHQRKRFCNMVVRSRN